MGSGNTKHQEFKFESNLTNSENKSKRKIFFTPLKKGDNISLKKQAPGIKGKSKRIKWFS